MSDHFVMLWGDMLASSIIEEEVHVKWAFVVCLLLCDHDGNFRSTPGHLARAGGMSIEEASAALEILSSPDEESTSGTEGGRRLISLGPNRWHVVNYKEYRLRQRSEELRIKWRDDKRRQRGTEVEDGGQVVDGGGPTVDPVHVPVSVPVPVCDDKGGSKGGKKRMKGFRFTRPSPADVRAYLDEKGETRIDPEDFCNFYESKGWVVGKSPMKDWKAAVRTWIRQRDKDGAKQRVGVRSDQAPTEAMKERSRRLKHILKHSNALLSLDKLTKNQAMGVRASAGLLSALAESDMPKALMEEEFYRIHDTMMLELYDGLSEEDQAALAADTPSGSVNWVRKELQARFKIPDPMEYDFDPADVPS